MGDLRQAASFEGLIILGVIYFVLNMLQKAGEKSRRSKPSAPPPMPPPEPAGTQEEGFSLEAVLREIERVKAEQRTREVEPAPPPMPQLPRAKAPPLRRAPPPARRAEVRGTSGGPLGRPAKERLTSHEEVEDRESLERGSIEVEESLEVLDETRRRPPPVPVDRDDDAERVADARIQAAQSRNRSHGEGDHRSFHERITQVAAPVKAAPDYRDRSRLREAIVWREILGPPRAFDV